MDRQKAEALLASHQESPVMKAVRVVLASELDSVKEKLLTADPQSVPWLQGKGKAYQSLLKRFFK